MGARTLNNALFVDPMKLLVINADDFGYGRERNDGIVECFQMGAITNTSLMINSRYVHHAISEAKANNMPLGLHMNITEGHPVSATSCVRSLLNKDGCFLSKYTIWEMASRGSLNMEEVKREMRAQIKLFIKLVGYIPQHIDGHHHINVFSGICEVFCVVLQEFSVRTTRLPIETGFEKRLSKSDPRYNFLAKVMEEAKCAKGVFHRHGIGTSDTFVGLSTMGDHMTSSRLKSALSQAFETTNDRANCGNIKQSTSQTCELMVHPGYRTGEHGGCGEGPDDFSQSKDREHEMKILQSKEMSEFYSDNNIQLVSFRHKAFHLEI